MEEAGTPVGGVGETPAPATVTTSDRVAVALGHAVKILRSYGFTDIAELADAKAHSTTEVRSVVVVGELKRGKSLLVNALLGVRDASPVDVDVSTSATLHFVPASDAHPAGEVDLVFPGSVQRAPRRALSDWVTYSGIHVRDPGAESLPTRAIIALERSSLPGTIVIDTPGAGGLAAAHAQLALQSAQQACVLVIVCDASSPLTAPEMAFIRDASATVESIVVAVTKTDKNVRRWKPIVEDDKRLIAEHLRRTVPVVGVSSVRALAAAERADSTHRAHGENSSGITELRRLIIERLDLGEHQHAVAGLRTALEGLRKVDDQITTDIQITADSDKALPELTAQRDKLQELKDHSGQWELHLGRDMTFARQAALSHLDEQLDEIRIKWTTRINKSGMDVLRKNSQLFTQEMETDLLGALSATVEVFLAKVHEIVGPLFDSDVVWNDIHKLVLSSLQQPDRLNSAEVASKRQGLLDPTVLTMGMMGTSMLGALLGVGAIAGVIWIGVNLGYKAMKAGKQNLLIWLRETLGTTAKAAQRMLEAAMTTSRTEIVLRQREHLRAQTELVTERLTAAKDAARLDAATKEKTLARLSKNQRIVAARSVEIETLIGELTTPRGSAA